MLKRCQTKTKIKKPVDHNKRDSQVLSSWWRIPDSNRGPADYDSVALTG